MSVVRWEVYDPDLDETWVFPMNPQSGALPERVKTITEQAVAASDAPGAALLFEGQDEPARLGWDGTILTEAFYLAMLTWFEKRRQLQLTDDLGQSWWVYLTKFSPKRMNRHNYPWAMTYSAECIVLDWPATP
jgi:hypothetical protein